MFCTSSTFSFFFYLPFPDAELSRFKHHRENKRLFTMNEEPYLKKMIGTE